MQSLKRMQLAVLMTLLLSHAKAEYDLQIRLYGYNNPTNRCPLCRQNLLLPPGCCDNHSNLGSCQGGERCDNAFFYCLKELNSPPDSDPSATTLCGFHTSQGKISHINANGEPIDFSRDSVLDIPNPFTLTGISPQWQGVQLYVEVADINGEHHSSNQLVDSFSININTSSIGVFSSPAWYNGTFGFASLQLSYRVECSVSYYTRCDTSCVTSGDCTCIPGFSGVACQNNINECSEAVCPLNSKCVDSVNAYSCNCLPGYSKVGGDCVPTSTDSDHMTTTTDHMTTTVDPMTTSDSHVTTHITTQEDHMTSSTDHMAKTTAASPTCGPNLTGPTCKVVLDNCTDANCTENGRCVGVRCECQPGYTGTRCEININDCEGVTCSGKGTCIDGVNQYMCDCQDGSTGQDCELGNSCAGVECSGHGTCRLEDEAGFSCDCDQGYTGQLCQLQDCTVSNCSHTQRCQDGRCVCRPEYTGAWCETLLGCLGVDCSGSGTCVQRGDGSYGCDCHTGFTGESCEKPANLTGSSGDAGPPPVTYLLPVGLLIAILILLAVIVAAVLLTRLYLHKHRHIYEDVIPGSAKIITHLNESYNSTGVVPNPTTTPKRNHTPQQATPPLPDQGSGAEQIHMPSLPARHMTLPASQRPNYENRAAIRSHRLSMIPRQETAWSRPGPEHRLLPHTTPVRETPFMRDGSHRPVLEQEAQLKTKHDRGLNINTTVPNAFSRRHRSQSHTWVSRGDAIFRPHPHAKAQRASSQNWSKQDRLMTPRDQGRSWRSQTVSHFTPRLSPIAGVGTVEEEREYENQDALNLSGVCCSEEFSSSEYMNFSPSMTPDLRTTEELTQDCQPYLYCQPSSSQLSYHHYDMEGGAEEVEERREEVEEGGEGVEEGEEGVFTAEQSLGRQDSFDDSFDTDNSFETVSETDKDEFTGSAARDAHLYEVENHLYNFDSHQYEVDSQLPASESDSHTYERIPE